MLSNIMFAFNMCYQVHDEHMAAFNSQKLVQRLTTS
jgi:hypothetical protein